MARKIVPRLIHLSKEGMFSPIAYSVCGEVPNGQLNPDWKETTCGRCKFTTYYKRVSQTPKPEKQPPRTTMELRVRLTIRDVERLKVLAQQKGLTINEIIGELIGKQFTRELLRRPLEIK